MDRHSEWRIDVARGIAGAFSAHPDVLMVVAGGSAARGEADPWSDLDLSVHWKLVDGAWLETPRLTALNGHRFTWMQYPGMEPPGWLEQYFLGDLKVDVAHLAIEWSDGELRAVQQELELSPERQETLEGMAGGVCLYGEDEFAGFQAKLAAYPDALAAAMVRKHLQFMPGWALSEQGLARGDLLLYYEVLLPVLRNVAGVLAGLNRKYVAVTKLKRIERWLSGLAIAPDGAAEHIGALLRAEDFDRHYDPIMESVIALVETHMPAVETTAARTLLGFPMKAARPPEDN